jgi:hypothetical protein
LARETTIPRISDQYCLPVDTAFCLSKLKDDLDI